MLPRRRSGRPHRQTGRTGPCKLLGFAALPLKPLPKPHPEGASKPNADWWAAALILPILREVGGTLNIATAIGNLVYRFPTIYGRLAPTKPLNVVTVRLWFEPGSYTALLPERGTGAYRQAGSGRRAVLHDHPAVQEQIIKILQYLRGYGLWLQQASRPRLHAHERSFTSCMGHEQGFCSVRSCVSQL
jgi:hypothetical protein